MNSGSAVTRIARPASRSVISPRRISALTIPKYATAKEDQIAYNTQDLLQQTLVFYAQFEDLIELLCDAANYGPEAKLEHRYSDLRQWMLSHYPILRPYVSQFLATDENDGGESLEDRDRPSDAFEFLFAAPNLHEFLRIDDGHMISRIIRSREAIALYANHLRTIQ